MISARFEVIERFPPPARLGREMRTEITPRLLVEADVCQVPARGEAIEIDGCPYTVSHLGWALCRSSEQCPDVRLFARVVLVPVLPRSPDPEAT